MSQNSHQELERIRWQRLEMWLANCPRSSNFEDSDYKEQEVYENGNVKKERVGSRTIEGMGSKTNQFHLV
jgi:hypothetical protein